MPTGDFISIYSALVRKKNHEYKREYIESDDCAILNLDWLEPKDCNNKTPILVVLPGMTGHSQSGYLVYLVQKAFENGWRVVVLVYPGTDLSTIKTARFIRTHVPNDLEICINHVHTNNPDSPIYCLGYSVGASLLVNYLANNSNSTPVKAAISCSNPFEVTKSVQHLQRSFISRLYNKHFLSSLKAMFQINKDIFYKHFPLLDPEIINKFSFVEEFDENITIKYYGYKDVNSFYNDMGCFNSLQKVSIPLLVVHSYDDPIISQNHVPIDKIKQNENIIFVTTKMGGHTGWLEGFIPNGYSWFDNLAFEWLNVTHINLTLKK